MCVYKYGSQEKDREKILKMVKDLEILISFWFYSVLQILSLTYVLSRPCYINH